MLINVELYCFSKVFIFSRINKYRSPIIVYYIHVYKNIKYRLLARYKYKKLILVLIFSIVYFVQLLIFSINIRVINALCSFFKSLKYSWGLNWSETNKKRNYELRKDKYINNSIMQQYNRKSTFRMYIYTF